MHDDPWRATPGDDLPWIGLDPAMVPFAIDLGGPGALPVPIDPDEPFVTW